MTFTNALLAPLEAASQGMRRNALSYDQPQGGMNNALGGFRDRLGMAESGGDYGVTNSLGYMGKYQFGDARLADYTRATGQNPLDDGTFSPSEQEAAFDWHLADIDRAIDALGPEAQGYSRDGLRAVAHLAGLGGMRRFVREGYNPADAYGTSAQAYYTRFSS